MKQPKTLPIKNAAPIGIGFGELLCCFQCGEKPEVENPAYGIWGGFTIISCPNRCHEEYSLNPDTAKYFWNEWANQMDWERGWPNRGYPKQHNVRMSDDKKNQ